MSPEDSPNKDKDLIRDDEVEGSKVPKMDEAEELTAEGVEGKPAESPDKEKEEAVALAPEIQEIMKKKGFKDVSQLAEAYKSSEKKITELEKNARLQSLTPEMIPQRPRVERQIEPVPELDKDPMDMSKEELNEYMTKREKAFESRIKGEYVDSRADEAWNREYSEAYEKIKTDPDRFVELRPIMNELYKQHPKANIHQLWDAADKIEKEDSQKRVEKIKKELGFEGVDTEKFKLVIAKARPGVISDAGGGGTVGGGKPKTKEERKKEIKTSIFGDSEGVIRD